MCNASVRALLLIVPFICIGGAARAQEFAIGPFASAPVVAVYLVADGEPCEVTIAVRQDPPREGDRLMVRLFDPEERLALWRYVEYADEETREAVAEAPGIELRPIETAPDEPVRFETEVTLDLPGVYQLRVSGWYRNQEVTVSASRELPWGVCFQNGHGAAWPHMPSPLYLWVPQRARDVNLSGGPLTVRDENGAELARIEDTAGAATIGVERTGVLWECELSPDCRRFAAGGMPFILCSSEEAARSIAGSVHILDDGTVVAHRVQRDIARLLPDMLVPDQVGATDDFVEDLADRREAWLADPLRNDILRESFLPMINHWLGAQNLAPDSHWGGSLDGWQEKAEAGERWDWLGAVEGLWAGASSHYGLAAEHLAQAALYDNPVNPYVGKRELLNRATAAALRDLMAMAEDETWPGTADMDPYPGMMAFALGQKTLPVYGVAAPHVAPEVREVWTEALRRMVDRSYCDGLVSARNQSSHYLVAFQAFADGSEDPTYEALARLYARRWVRGQHETGYHMEAIGPDASYIGMTHWHEAVYYRMSEDPVVLDSIRRSYRLFNHTVGPEPDGRMLGGFNFNHRVGEGFYFEQWQGAKGILDDVLPEVGVWAGPEPTEEQLTERRAAAVERIERFLADPVTPRYPDITSARYWYYAEPDRSGRFPAEEEEPFIRRFGDEFIFVNRPGYYAACWVGKPAGEWYIRKREDFRLPLPDDAEDTGDVYPDMRKSNPFGGGGLTGVWTRDFGHSLMAANWSPTTHHGLIATQADGRRYWEDYHGHEFALDEDAGTLTITGHIEAVPVDYVRTYEFGDETLGVSLELTAREETALEALVENFPVARGGWKSRGSILSAAEREEGEVTAARFTVLDAAGAGIEVTLEEPMPLRLVPEGLRTGGWRQLQIGRVEIGLPVQLAAGETVTLRYTIRPVTPQG